MAAYKISRDEMNAADTLLSAMIVQRALEKDNGKEVDDRVRAIAEQIKQENEGIANDELAKKIVYSMNTSVLEAKQLYPDAATEIENEVQAEDVSEIMNDIVAEGGFASISSKNSTKRTLRILQKYERENPEEGLPPLRERIQQALKDKAPGLIKAALITGSALATGGSSLAVTASMMAAKKAFGSKAGQAMVDGLNQKVQSTLVNSGIVSQESLDKAKDSIAKTGKKYSKSLTVGKTLVMVGMGAALSMTIPTDELSNIADLAPSTRISINPDDMIKVADNVTNLTEPGSGVLLDQATDYAGQTTDPLASHTASPDATQSTPGSSTVPDAESSNVAKNMGDEAGVSMNSSSYEVKAGDNLWTIVKESYTSTHGSAPSNKEIMEMVQTVGEANDIKNLDLIYPGDQLDLSGITPDAAPESAIEGVKSAEIESPSSPSAGAAGYSTQPVDMSVAQDFADKHLGFMHNSVTESQLASSAALASSTVSSPEDIPRLVGQSDSTPFVPNNALASNNPLDSMNHENQVGLNDYKLEDEDDAFSPS